MKNAVGYHPGPIQPYLNKASLGFLTFIRVFSVHAVTEDSIWILGAEQTVWAKSPQTLCLKQ